jgi:hypothetical protein
MQISLRVVPATARTNAGPNLAHARKHHADPARYISTRGLLERGLSPFIPLGTADMIR